MAQNSAIEWTNHTFNPWWGCTKVSPGCTHCYAETLSNRYGHDIWGPKKDRRVFGDNHWQEPLKWNKQALHLNQRMRVFCASMADVFEDNTSVEKEREKLWRLIEETPMLDWLLLTKRPENMIDFVPWDADWPKNVWAMTSVENQTQAEERIPILSKIPAVVKGLSIEPLLGPVNLLPWLKSIQWVIVGGESGIRARPMNPKWVMEVRDQCILVDVPFFFKQWGEWSPIDIEQYNLGIGQTITTDHNGVSFYMKRTGKKIAGRLLDGEVWNQFPIAAEHRFAADAAGAAPDLGAILWRDGAPSLVPVGGGRQRCR